MNILYKTFLGSILLLLYTYKNKEKIGGVRLKQCGLLYPCLQKGSLWRLVMNNGVGLPKTNITSHTGLLSVESSARSKVRRYGACFYNTKR